MTSGRVCEPQVGGTEWLGVSHQMAQGAQMLYDMGGEMCPGSQGDLGEKLPRMVGVEVDIGDDK